MKKQYVSESPEWTRLYWAVMAIAALVILSSLFGCESEELPFIKSTEDYIAQYWLLICGLPTVLAYWLYRNSKTWVRLLFGLVFMLGYIVTLLPYMMMFFLWVLTQLS